MNRFLHAIYCDDVREEKGNKLSLMGVYGSDLYVSQFPTVLPKLGIYITLATPAEQPLSKLTVRVKKDEEILLESSISEADIAKHTELVGQEFRRNEQPNSEGATIITTVRSVFFLAPFPILGPCILRVIATTEAGELRCPALRISLAPSVVEPASLVAGARMES